MKKVILVIGFVMCLLLVQAQTRRQMGGVYCAYPFTEVETGKTLSIEKYEDEDNLVLEGYTPFYISHYGRHGSRWMPHDDRYTWVNRHFEDVSNLTPLGKKVRKILWRVWDNAQGNGGKLSKLGALQHRGIANRMYQRFPPILLQVIV